MNPPNEPRRPAGDGGPASDSGLPPMPPRPAGGQRNPPGPPQRPQPPLPGGPAGPPSAEDLAGSAGPTLPGGGRSNPPPPPPSGGNPGGQRSGFEAAGPTVPKGGRQAPPRPAPPQPPSGPPGAPHAPGNPGGPTRSGGPSRPQPLAGPPGSRLPAPSGPGHLPYGGGLGQLDGGPSGQGGPPPSAGAAPQLGRTNHPAGEEVSPEAWPPGGTLFAAGPAGPGQAFGENDRTMPAKLPPAEAAAAALPKAAAERKPVRRKDVLISALLYLVGAAVAFGFAYDLFAKLFDLVHNRCALQKKDFTVQCAVIRPPASALWGLLIGGGGMFLVLVGAMVLAAVAAMTGRRAWIWTAAALPIIAVAGGAGHILVATAIN
ncbi:hypothetical protein GPX89_22580 [Nocardia sp. ET3-3]|uniref:Uncharacterized protein n=1 Tax=Nocardia terrae TaxID=2675851 RepID=A0A7K1V0Q9_9NOCA|nr:hypothetical protein [Nocardia terrae]MVU80019.1 hypothetical protein [Nocardia terrae]